MAEKTDGKLIDHEYDGIREYDNPTPAWWHMIFIGTVVFGLLYFVFFQLGSSGWTVVEAHQNAVANNLKLRFEEIGDLEGDEATLLTYMHEDDWLKVGATVYTAQCKSCHAEKGVGNVGPNLTDDYYKNVKKLVEIVDVIEKGAANGSMPAWRNRLHPNEIVLVAAYVAKMRGQNLPGKKTEGDLIDPWPKAPLELPATDNDADDSNTGADKTPEETP